MKQDKICIDTDMLQDYLLNKKKAVETIAEIEKTADCATTALSVFELFCIAEQTEKPDENIKVVEDLIERMTILQFTSASCKQAAKLFTELQKLSKKPEIRDILVGVLIKQQNYIIATSDKERYKLVPGLKIYK
ncbi:hypothetical protein COV16_03315 [Candidatus Woesearchaeota archaeon CG10_big_fil_rev_8_21_14_0_10_34_8]|nr:MAG: hypothetical protein COV16_03315 [Candidatus Woesearchaeota archaeon CG10_big_fil_rev_8_21_14_0_10_34_8]